MFVKFSKIILYIFFFFSIQVNECIVLCANKKNEINGKEIENIKKSNQIKKLDKENQTAIEKSEREKNS